MFIAIASGACIDPELCAKVVHYRVKGYRDPIPQIHRSGIEAAKDTIVELPCHPEASYLDHDFTSKTYQEVLQLHMKNYIESGGKKF